jgi:hypothetical protein
MFLSFEGAVERWTNSHVKKNIAAETDMSQKRKLEELVEKNHLKIKFREIIFKHLSDETGFRRTNTNVQLLQRRAGEAGFYIPYDLARFFLYDQNKGEQKTSTSYSI